MENGEGAITLAEEAAVIAAETGGMSGTLGIIGMLLAIAVMIVGAFRGMKAIPLTLLAAFVVIVFNGMGLWSSYSQYYAGSINNTFGAFSENSFGGVISRLFFMFIASSAYAMVMEKTGSTAAIGMQLVKWFGTKHVIWVIYVFTCILTMGGVNLFVCVFAVTPIAFVLFREANLPRHLIMAPMAAGGATITMTTLPGAPSLPNVFASDWLDTQMTAAPVFSLIFATAVVALTAVYFKYALNDALKKKETFNFPVGYDSSSLTIDKSKLPNPIIAFFPIAVLIPFILASIVLKAPYAVNAAGETTPILLTTLAMVIAIVLCLILNIKRIPTVASVKNWFGDGANNGVVAMAGLAAVIAFGNVVSHAPVFQSVVKWITELPINEYVKGVISTGIISGITGSSSGGLNITFQNLAGHFRSIEGLNLDILHRVMAIAGGTFDTLPHVSSIFLFLAILGCTHKEAYKHLWWTTVVIPTVLIVIALIPVVLIFRY